MEWFGLLLGHLFGDYVVQNDWMAANKAAVHPGAPPDPEGSRFAGMPDAAHQFAVGKWAEVRRAYRTAPLACTVHCLCYTVAVALFSFWWMPWWGLLVCFLAHWPLDRFRLAGRLMRNVLGQRQFASGPLSPSSLIIVDNTLHLFTLGVIAVISGQR